MNEKKLRIIKYKINVFWKVIKKNIKIGNIAPGPETILEYLLNFLKTI